MVNQLKSGVEGNPLDLLNARQHKFVLNLFSGMSQTEAYIQAGYEPCSREIAAAAASELLVLPNISEAFDYLKHSATKEVGLTYEQCLAKLAEIAEHPVEVPISASHRIDAIRETGKLKSYYPAEKHLVAGKVQVEINYIDRDENAS